MCTEATDLSPTSIVGFAQGYNSVQRRDKVSNDIWLTRMWGELKMTIEARQFRREWQVTSMLYVEECVECCQSIHARTPQTEKNSARRAALLSYSPRQNVVRVKGAVSRTPRICVQR